MARLQIGLFVALLLAALVGCSGGSDAPAQRRAAKQPGQPRVGDCWRTTPALIPPPAWEGPPAVSCAQAHNAVTYAVGTLPRSTPYARVARSVFAIRAVGRTCNQRAGLAYLGAVIARDGSQALPLRVATASFAPTRSQWRAGARWFRCDLGVPRLVGSQQWTTLPADLVADVTRHRVAYQICSTGRDDPFARRATRGACDRRAHWLEVKQVRVARRLDEPYPGRTVVVRRVRRACAEGGIYAYPTRKGWRERVPGSCWVPYP